MKKRKVFVSNTGDRSQLHFQIDSLALSTFESISYHRSVAAKPIEKVTRNSDHNLSHLCVLLLISIIGPEKFFGSKREGWCSINVQYSINCLFSPQKHCFLVAKIGLKVRNSLALPFLPN